MTSISVKERLKELEKENKFLLAKCGRLEKENSKYIRAVSKCHQEVTRITGTDLTPEEHKRAVYPIVFQCSGN